MTPTSVTPSSGFRSLLPFGGALVAVVALDQVTKASAVSSLEPCASALTKRTFDLCLAYNKGMAFSLGSGSGPVIAAVAIVIVTILAVSSRTIPSTATRVIMGVVAGGAVGNVVDRAFRPPAGFMRGEVVDFLYSSFWPTFNVADSCIVVGGLALAVLMWRTPTPESTESDPAESDPAESLPGRDG